MDREVGREPGKAAVQEKWNEENKKKEYNLLGLKTITSYFLF